jgi:hypothetical protein
VERNGNKTRKETEEGGKEKIKKRKWEILKFMKAICTSGGSTHQTLLEDRLAIHGGKESGEWGGPLKEKQWGKCFFEKIMERFRRQLMALFFF